MVIRGLNFTHIFLPVSGEAESFDQKQQSLPSTPDSLPARRAVAAAANIPAELGNGHENGLISPPLLGVKDYYVSSVVAAWFAGGCRLFRTA